jgi:hypothetical protein
MAGNNEERGGRSACLQAISQCHSERSEESLTISGVIITYGNGREVFRFAQHDSAIHEMDSGKFRLRIADFRLN